MKKYNKISYIVIIIIILICGFFIYRVFAKKGEDGSEVKRKSFSEVKFIESKLLSMFNDMNNINFENYKLSTKEVKESTTSKSSEESSSGEEGGSGSSGSSEGKAEEGGDSSKSSSSTSGSEQTGKSDGENVQYNLEETGVLTSEKEVDWDKVKNEAEGVYEQIYTMTLDLYQTSTNQQDIVNFNKEYDNLIKAVKEENKDNTLKVLSTLYDYLPKFAENCSDEEKEIVIIKTKNEILKAYSILDKEDWNLISNNVNSAIQEFTKLVTNIKNQESRNQYNINKCYIMLNELQNAVQLKDKDIFLIKYKNLLEELENI